MDYKTEIKVFAVWQEEREKVYLEAMAKRGWLLKRAKLIIYRFVKATPQDYVYEFDYTDKGAREYQNKIDFYSDLGWKHIASQFGWHYYRALRSDVQDSSFYTDAASIDLKYKPLVRFLIIVSLMNLFIGIFNIITPNAIGKFSIINVLIAFLLAYGIYHVQRKIIYQSIKREQKS